MGEESETTAATGDQKTNITIIQTFLEVQLHGIYPSLPKTKLVPVAPKSMPLTAIY